jgi:hypothetical protein
MFLAHPQGSFDYAPKGSFDYAQLPFGASLSQQQKSTLFHKECFFTNLKLVT